MKTLGFHVTPAVNVPAILQDGLLPQVGPRSRQLESEAGIFVFLELDALEDALANWMMDAFDEGVSLALLAVDLTGRGDVRQTGAEYERCVMALVAPADIQIITGDLDMTPDWRNKCKTLLMRGAVAAVRTAADEPTLN